MKPHRPSAAPAPLRDWPWIVVPLAVGSSVVCTRLLVARVVEPHTLLVIIMGSIATLTVVLWFEPQWRTLGARIAPRPWVVLDPATGAVRIVARRGRLRRRGRAGRLLHAAPAWAVEVATRRTGPFGARRAALVFPDGARVGVSARASQRVARLRDAHLARGSEAAAEPPAPVELVLGRRASVAAAAAALGAFVALAGAGAWVAALWDAPERFPYHPAAAPLLAGVLLSAAALALGRLRTVVRVVDGRAVRVQHTFAGRPLGRGRVTPFLDAALWPPNAGRALLRLGARRFLAMPALPEAGDPAHDPLARAGAAAIADAARALRARLVPLLAHADAALGAAHYRDPADAAHAASRAAASAPDAVLALREAPEPVWRTLRGALDSAAATLLSALR
ncbi:MAG TPA: hypothetical protein VG389_28755 [Myxococcota bacterium]|nr:hypothetical protein [Myxococcota bacterium]